MNKQTWLIAGGLSALVLVLFVSLANWQRGQELRKAREQLATQRVAAEEAQQKAERLETELTEEKARAQEIKGELEQLRQEAAATTRAQQGIEDEMRKALQSKDVTISELQGRLTVSILDRIMFDSGEAVLKTEGEKVLLQIAGVLSQYPKRQIHVIGHTDNVPIRASARSRFPSNWELSTARATAAVRFLQENAGVDPRRLGAVGYGEYHPLADNSTPEGRARNRRIAIVVLPEEIATAESRDTPSSPRPAIESTAPDKPGP